MISRNELEISLIELEISLNELEISIMEVELEISAIELLISLISIFFCLPVGLYENSRGPEPYTPPLEEGKSSSIRFSVVIQASTQIEPRFVPDILTHLVL